MVEDGFDKGLCAEREAIRKVSDAEPKQFVDGQLAIILDHRFQGVRGDSATV